MFPENRIRLDYRVVVGTNSLGEDIIDTVPEFLDGVMVAPASTSNQPYPHQNYAATWVELHLPASFTKSINGVHFEVLDGPFAGRVFETDGDPMPYEFVVLKWNRVARLKEIYDGD